MTGYEGASRDFRKELSGYRLLGFRVYSTTTTTTTTTMSYCYYYTTTNYYYDDDYYYQHKTRISEGVKE